MTDPLGALSPRRRAGLAVLSGGLAALSLPPFDLWPFVFAGFGGIITLIVTAATPRAGFALGWWAGVGWFGVALHWIVQPFFVDPAATGWMAPFAIVLMAGGLALFWGGAGALVVRLGRGLPARAALCIALMTGAEMLRGRIFSGLPWAHPGHGLIDSAALVLAPIGGAHLMGLWVLSLGACAALLVLTRRARLALVPLGVGLALGAAPLMPVAPPPTPDAPVLRLVQINAPQDQKWDPAMIDVFFTRALDLTAAAPGPLGPPDLSIWPETALPVLLERSEAERSQIMAASQGRPVILGGQRYAGPEPRNVLALVSEDQVAAVYDKHHLVPFGEYLPLRGLAARLGLRGLADLTGGGYYPGPGPQTLDLGPLGRVFPMICYEAIFPHYIALVPRPDWQVQITNDAWFGSFAMPYQHLALARLRAAEQGLPLVRVANTGISAVIDARGQIVAQIPMERAGIVDAALPGAIAETLFSQFGNASATVLAFLVALWGLWAGRLPKAH